MKSKNLKKTGFLLLIFILGVYALNGISCSVGATKTNGERSNEHSAERMLIVIAAPSVHDSYYNKHFNMIIDFDIRYAKSVLGKDNIIVLADKDTLPYLEKELPKDILLEAELEDIWMRDFTTVMPEKMLQFVYDRPAEPNIQKSFLNFAREYDLRFAKVDLKLDGGNIVDNNKDAIVVTEKIMERNPKLSKSQIVTKLKKALAVKRVAIIPMDDEFLGHSDGMLMFLGDNTLVVNNYRTEPGFKKSVTRELEKALPNTNLLDIDGDGYGEKYGPYASACGIYVNSVVTYNYIYMPVFSNKTKDKKALKLIRANTDKEVVPVNTKDVCFLGGNVRCLSWQVTGDNARKLIEAAR